MSSGDDCAAARLACSWLLTYPDDRLLARLDNITEVALAQPTATREPLLAFLAHVADTPLLALQQHYVALFDMRRRACPYLSYWTDGETRNRGMALVRFKQAYAEAGFTLGDDELPDHLAVRYVITDGRRELAAGKDFGALRDRVHALIGAELAAMRAAGAGEVPAGLPSCDGPAEHP